MKFLAARLGMRTTHYVQEAIGTNDPEIAAQLICEQDFGISILE